MSNTGFKGTVLQFRELSIRMVGGALQIHIQVLFTAADGTVHAQVTHNIALHDRPDLMVPVTALLEECKKYIERMHFENTNENNRPEQVSHGIAEALSQKNSSSDEPGGQG